MVPATERFTVVEIAFLSSPELTTDLVFSSAELPLIDGRERCEAIAELLNSLRAEVLEDIVVGRVRGLERVLAVRASEIFGFVDGIRFSAALLLGCECFTGFASDAAFLGGDRVMFSLSAASELGFTSSPPECAPVAGAGASAAISGGGTDPSAVPIVL